MKPTEADVARDLLADLALCEDIPENWQVGVGVHEWVPKDRPMHYYASLPYRPTAKQAGEDAARILAMRKGWPAAIRRALAAEAELAALKAAPK